MPRLKIATDANGTKFYPISISKGVYDTDRNKRMNAVIDDICGCLNNIGFDETTGELYIQGDSSIIPAQNS